MKDDNKEAVTSDDELHVTSIGKTHILHPDKELPVPPDVLADCN